MCGVVSRDPVFCTGLYVFIVTGSRDCVSRVLGFLGVGQDRVVDFVEEYERVLRESSRDELLKCLRERLRRDKGIYKLSVNRIRELADGDKDILFYSLLWIHSRYGDNLRDKIHLGDLARFSTVMLCRNISTRVVASLFEETLLGVRHDEYIILLPHAWRVARKFGSKKKIPSQKEVYKTLKKLEDHLIPLVYSVYTRVHANKLLYKKTYGVERDEVLNTLAVKGIVYKGISNRLLTQIVVDIVKKITMEKTREIIKRIGDVLEKSRVKIDYGKKFFLSKTLCTLYQAEYNGQQVGVYVCPYALNTLYPTYDINIIVMKGLEPSIHEYLVYTPALNVPNTLWVYIVGEYREALIITRDASNPLFKMIAEETTRRFNGKTLVIQLPYTRSRLLNPMSFRRNLIKDIERARQRLVVISPFLKKSIVARSIGDGVLARALEKKISVKVVTLSPSSRGIRERGELRVREQEECIKLLTESGVDVVLKNNMHFKAVLVDDHIVYIGSVNPLSTIPLKSNDYMIRVEDKNLVEEIEEAVGLREQAT
ncbi:hypothetical protein J4526_05985 [Desulfurococcaceae archaeon MEX13E-LK6-19]|nr:hypothetical protein J4526_05985 [Desulfurococcaceae archaeon MEX13E-LK6-19]